jgi:hypothetical protein
MELAIFSQHIVSPDRPAEPGFEALSWLQHIDDSRQSRRSFLAGEPQ